MNYQYASSWFHAHFVDYFNLVTATEYIFFFESSWLYSRDF